MQKTCIFILTSLSLFWEFTAAQRGSCLNYYNQPGTCVPIASCKPLFDLQSNPGKTYSDLLFLNGNYCGSENTWVCCTSTESSTVTPSPAIISTSTPSAFVGPFKIVTPLPSKRDISQQTNPSRGRSIEVRLLPDPSKHECGLHFPDRVHGGNETAIDEHPWTVLLQYTLPDASKIFGCGGSLINQQTVITAAHCIPSSEHSFSLTSVRLGEWNTATEVDCHRNVCSEAPIDVAISEVIIHPGYNKSAKIRYDDIALLRLARKVNYSSTIRPICLPFAQELRNISHYQGRQFTVVGWGATKNSSTSDIKLKVDLPFVPLHECENIYKKSRSPFKIRETVICAGGNVGQGSCNGDSGGPLIGGFSPERGVHYNYLAGVISFGTKSCAKRKWPGIFTNTVKYLDWIEENVKL